MIICNLTPHFLPSLSPPQAPDMVFQPSLDQDHTDGFYNMVDGLLDEIFRFASLVPRVATHLETPDYHTDVEEVGK